MPGVAPVFDHCLPVMYVGVVSVILVTADLFGDNV